MDHVVKDFAAKSSEEKMGESELVAHIRQLEGQIDKLERQHGDMLTRGDWSKKDGVTEQQLTDLIRAANADLRRSRARLEMSHKESTASRDEKYAIMLAAGIEDPDEYLPPPPMRTIK